MPLDPLWNKNALDWMLGGANPSSPAGRWLGLATQSPTSQSDFEGRFSPRASIIFGAAASPAGSASNVSSFITISCVGAAGTAVGWNLWDAQVGGNRIAYGTASANIGCKSGDNVLVSVNILRITMA